MGGESRRLALLFCDLVGSTRLSTDLEPEDEAVIKEAFRRCALDVIGSQGGEVRQFAGDEVYAWFGYPVASEDDPERAARAALHLLAALQSLRPLPGVTLSARVGVACGKVAVTPLTRSSTEVEVMATGGAVSLAKRLQEAARPGSVLVCAETRQLLAESFDIEESPPLALKGFGEGHFAFCLGSERSSKGRFDARGDVSRTQPMVGRESELSALLSGWHAATQANGLVVVVEGEAGIGKSRLVAAFQSTLPRDSLNTVTLHCNPRTAGSSLAPVISFLRAAAGISVDTAAAVALGQLEALLAAYLPENRTAECLPYVCQVLGLPSAHGGAAAHEGPELRRARAMAALQELLLALASARPVLLAVEDLHWCDPTTIELLSALAGRIAEFPILMLVTTRPGFHVRWPARARVSTHQLARLGQQSAMQIVQRIAGDMDLAAADVAGIVERSDGVPLHLEELTRDMLEARISPVERRAVRHDPRAPGSVPPALYFSLRSRIDRLGPATGVAQVLSVLGREAPLLLVGEVLRRAIDSRRLPEVGLQEAVRALAAADLLAVREARTGDVIGFRHALIQETAYESMLRQTRETLHAAAAGVMAEGTGGLAHPPEILAFHQLKGGDPGGAALNWLKAAADAVNRAAYEEATNFALQGLEAMRVTDPCTERDLLELNLLATLGRALSSVKGYADSEVIAAFERALDLCQTHGDRGELFAILRGMCTHFIVRGELSSALDLAERCARLADRTGRPEHEVEALTALGYIRFYFGEINDGIGLLQRATEVCRTHTLDERLLVSPQHSYLACVCLLSHALLLAGRIEEALAAAESVREFLEMRQRPFEDAYAAGYLAMFWALFGVMDVAQGHAARGVEVSTRFGYPDWASVGRIQSAIIAVAQENAGEWPTALEALSGELDLWLARGSMLSAPLSHGWLARARLRVGQVTEALEAIQTGLALAARLGERYGDADLFTLQAQIMTAIGQPDAAREALATAIGIAARQGARFFELQALMIGLSSSGVATEALAAQWRARLGQIVLEAGEASVRHPAFAMARHALGAGLPAGGERRDDSAQMAMKPDDAQPADESALVQPLASLGSRYAQQTSS
jgi:class 3 adenylate cyclase/tetratricopeptide (TPR) repeat protein